MTLSLLAIRQCLFWQQHWLAKHLKKCLSQHSVFWKATAAIPSSTSSAPALVTVFHAIGSGCSKLVPCAFLKFSFKGVDLVDYCGKRFLGHQARPEDGRGPNSAANELCIIGQVQQAT